MQSFYAILDGTATAFNTVTSPVTRSNLTPFTATNLSTTTGNTLTAGTDGWYMDLGIDAISGVGWRVLINPEAYNGIVTFSTLLTSGSDPCNPSGTSRVYAFDYSTATSVLQPTSTGSAPPPYDSIADFAVIEDRFAGDNGTPEILIGGNNGTNERVNASLTGTLATRILNWREIPTVD
jgi:type IV pilus assembly protein PilY1